MESRTTEDSGVFSQPDLTRPSRLQPETVIVAVAWVLAIVQVGVGLARYGAFGPDRGVAIAFALGCPLLFRAKLFAFAQRLAGLGRGSSRPAKG